MTNKAQDIFDSAFNWYMMNVYQPPKPRVPSVWSSQFEHSDTCRCERCKFLLVNGYSQSNP